MIKNENELRRILRADESVTTEELEQAAGFMLTDLKVIVDTSLNQGVKSIAQEKIDLIKSAYEYSEENVNLASAGANAYGMPDTTICRYIRRRLREDRELTIDEISNMMGDLSKCETAEAQYLRGVLVVKRIQILGDPNNALLNEAVAYLETACKMDPDNELYKEYGSTLNQVLSEDIQRREKELAHAKEQQQIMDEQLRRQQEEANRRVEQQRIAEAERYRQEREKTIADSAKAGLSTCGSVIAACLCTCCCEETCSSMCYQAMGCQSSCGSTPCTCMNCCADCQNY